MTENQIFLLDQVTGAYEVRSNDTEAADEVLYKFFEEFDIFSIRRDETFEDIHRDLAEIIRTTLTEVTSEKFEECRNAIMEYIEPKPEEPEPIPEPVREKISYDRAKFEKYLEEHASAKLAKIGKRVFDELN